MMYGSIVVQAVDGFQPVRGRGRAPSVPYVGEEVKLCPTVHFRASPTRQHFQSAKFD